VSIVEHGLGLNITLQSYAGSLEFGVIAARVGIPDARPLARALEHAFADLQRSIDAHASAPARKPARSRKAVPARGRPAA
jgi:hypothetical protein